MLLRLDRAAAARRDAEPDRIEAEGDGFQDEVARGFEEAGGRFPHRIVEVDAGGSPRRGAGAGARAVGV